MFAMYNRHIIFTRELWGSVKYIFRNILILHLYFYLCPENKFDRLTLGLKFICKCIFFSELNILTLKNVGYYYVTREAE